MCGIFAVINKFRTLNDPDILRRLELVEHRGPDASSTVTLDLRNGYFLHMMSYVLHLRGSELVSQPYQHENGDVLQWNGEVFGGLEVKESESDTVKFADRLRECETDDAICDVFRRIQGPMAFIFYHKATKKIWFGRDYFGRRSILYRLSKNEFILTSVARKPTNGEKWMEVPADGFYVVDTKILTEGVKIRCHFWKAITNPTKSKIETLKLFNNEYINSLTGHTTDENDFPLLLSAVKPWKCNLDRFLPQIDTDSMASVDILKTLCRNEDFSNIVNEFLDTLKEAVQKRVINVPKKQGPSSISVLFSGGIDCTVIALLANEFVSKDEPINLLNVAFETPSKNKSFDVPDRITGRSALSELQSLCPERNWNFIEVDVTIAELQKMRKIIISDLTYPLLTVLDDSIGCALWFAARGVKGLEKNEFDTKVVLSGLGADEQLGGYSRHRSAFEKYGWDGLENEIKMEIERLSSRNLGRDDRIITDHGKEVRFPYLDENVVSFLNQTPLPYKADFSFKRGVGEKILLRAAGYVLGLRNVAVFPKRAIQFGSRIAKAESRKEKASDVCERLF